MEEDMAVDVLMGQGQQTPFLLIRLDVSDPRDSPATYPIGPQSYGNNPLPWISLPQGHHAVRSRLISHPQQEGSRTTHIPEAITHPPHCDVKTRALCDWVVSVSYSATLNPRFSRTFFHLLP
jgi:hypothetical protein